MRARLRLIAVALVLAASAASGVHAAERIIISGASGQLGGATVEALLARGVPARNLILVSRTPEKLAKYAQLGASVRFGDFSKPESLPAAYAGGTRMLLVSISGGAGPRPAAHKRAIDAAIAAGVKFIAYTSWLAISQGETSGIAADHVQTEDILRKSGVAWAMLRNSVYMDQILGQAAKMAADGRVVVPAQDSRMSYVTRADCAAAAAAVLTTPGHDNQVYDITGPELIGPRELAAAVSAVTGKPVEVVSADASAAAPRGFTGLGVTSDAVARLTGKPATSVRTFLEAHKDKLLPPSG
ncbi:MAG TPA: NAD(P)H-binding protein [Steroidobacteraceae bacterium]|nr:NAD(P)H-binding protein [Steroidobacteraceae bacterium]